MQKNKKDFERVLPETKPDDFKKGYLLRKRQEFESSQELKEFFYAPEEFPVNEDPDGN